MKFLTEIGIVFSGMTGIAGLCSLEAGEPTALSYCLAVIILIIFSLTIRRVISSQQQ